MQLNQITQQRQLLYFSRDADAMAIYENQHYRWLAFNQVIQTLMLKRDAWRLTLPHQRYMMLPLLYFKPQTLLEFGLGGGSFQRFIHHLTPAINLCSVEYNDSVIQCFERFFWGNVETAGVLSADARQYLQHHSVKCFDWLIYDIYQQADDETNSFQTLLQDWTLLLTKSSANAWLTMNIPNATKPELQQLLVAFEQINQQKQLSYFYVPRYRNVIIHVHPPITERVKSYLPIYQQRRWQKLWQTRL